MVGGAIIGGALSAFGLMTSLAAVPVLLIAGLSIVGFRLRREPRTTLIDDPALIRPTDPRVWPFLLAGFGMFTALGFIQASPDSSSRTASASTPPPPDWSPAQRSWPPASAWSSLKPSSSRAWDGDHPLLRTGSATALIGFVVLIPDLGMAILPRCC